MITAIEAAMTAAINELVERAVREAVSKERAAIVAFVMAEPPQDSETTP